MFLKSFLSKVYASYEKTQKKRIIPLLNPSKDELERLILEKISKLEEEKSFRKALELLNESIASGVTTNQILHKKAFLLSQNKEFEEAHSIWEKLSKLENKPKLSESARQCLQKSKKIQHEAIKAKKLLIDSLHSKAELFQHQLKHLPKSNEWSPTKDNLVALIRKEAEQARNSDLPKLATYLINQSQLAGLSSPLLNLDKALSLNMMGQKTAALKLLEELKDIKNPKIKNQVEAINTKIAQDSDYHQSRIGLYLYKQAKAVALSNGYGIEVHDSVTSEKISKIKSLIYEEAEKTLKPFPQASLAIINSILGYFPNDGASLQLQGEALNALGRFSEAIQTLKGLAHSNNQKIAQKACLSISTILTQKAIETSKHKSPEETLTFFIKEHLKLNITPNLTPGMEEVLKHTHSFETDSSDPPELHQRELEIQFNILVIEQLEIQLHAQN